MTSQELSAWGSESQRLVGATSGAGGSCIWGHWGGEGEGKSGRIIKFLAWASSRLTDTAQINSVRDRQK